MRWLLLLFVVVPLIELYLLIFVGSQIGFWPTLGIVLLTGIVGAALAKHEGLRVWHSYRDALSQGRLPDEGIVGGLLVLLGGTLLVTPGLLTDIVGFSLLIPQSRHYIAEYIRAIIAKKLDQSVVHVISHGPGGFVDMRGPGPMDDPFVHSESFEHVFRRRSHDQGDVVDTEGVEVQQTLLLGEGERSTPDEKDPERP